MEKAVRVSELLFKWILYGLLVFVAFFIVTQDAKAAIDGKIAGVIVDARTGEPLPGVNVIIEGTDRGAACDADGYYYIIRLEPGIYNVQARMMGYTLITKTDVRVISGHTTQLNFELQATVVEGEGITVQAEREVVKMDLSSSSFSADKSEIEAVPLISDVTSYLNLQAGIDGWSVRGGRADETKLLADGLLLVDQRKNEPILMPNLSEIKEVSLLKGGFDAEYSNVRSGVVSVVTKEGSPVKYEGSCEFRYTPGYQKHSGQSIFDPDNYYNVSFLRNKLDTGIVWIIVGGDTVGDSTVIKYDSVCWKGTSNVWNKTNSPFYDTVKFKTYPKFKGWIAQLGRDTTSTLQEQYDRLLWMRRIDIPRTDSLLLIYNGGDSMYAPVYGGAGDTTLIGYEKVPYTHTSESRRGVYGNQPDWTADAGFGGPIPVIGQYLGNMTFFTSYRDHNETFAIPDSREYYRERMASLKLTSRFGNIKVNLKGAYSIINSLSPFGWGDQEGNSDYPNGNNGQVYLRGGSDMLDPLAYYDGRWHGSDKLSLSHLFRVDALTPIDVTSRMYGLTMQHALSENTFYDIKLTYIRSNNRAQFYYDVPVRMGGDTIVMWFGKPSIGSKWALDNLPYGWADPDYEDNNEIDIGGAEYRVCHQLGTWNTSWSQSYSTSFDMSSQLNKYNLVKFGLSFQYDKLHEYFICNDGWVWPPDSIDPTEYSGQQYSFNSFDGFPILAGAYIQDKIEFEGMFANFGLRFDYSDPNTDWFTSEERYSLFFSNYMKDDLLTLAPRADVASLFEISPRLGISFPILERSKLFFNYGHFYSLPTNENRYKINWGEYKNPIIFLGNPALEMARTISYEVGFESSIASTYLARVSGYYKDADNEPRDVGYESYYGDVNYLTPENNGYGDTRGFEFEFRKTQGRFFTGWVIYDYRAESSGQLGLLQNYEDPLKQSLETEVNPEEDRPIPRPVFRAQLTLLAPEDWGIFLGGYNLSFLYSWRAGYYQTFNPIAPEWDEELQNNLRWQDERNVDIGISKNLSVGGTAVSLFMNVHNVFDWGTLSSQAFSSSIDQNAYLSSLHLDIYNEEPFLSDPYRNGPEEGEEPDHVGDLRSDEKPYINNPDREFLWYLDPRYVQFGIRFSF
jgi:hypothetical protein